MDNPFPSFSLLNDQPNKQQSGCGSHQLVDYGTIFTFSGPKPWSSVDEFGATWMSQEVSKRLVSGLQVGDCPLHGYNLLGSGATYNLQVITPIQPQYISCISRL